MATNYPKFLYESRLKDATPVASSTAAGNYSVLNLRDCRPYTWWKPSAMPATVTVNSGSAKSVDYWAVYGHDIFTQGATIELRGSTDNFAASNVLVDTFTPASNANFVRFIASTSYQYWRITLTGATAPSLAIVLMGVALDIPGYLPSGFDPKGRVIKGQYNRSELGHPLGRTVKFEEFAESLKFEWLLASWLRSTFEPAWTAHIGRDPFIFMWDPIDHPAELFLVGVKDQFKTPHKPGGYCDLTIDVMGVFV